MKSEDILAELRAWRDEFARKHDYDLAAMTAALREMDRAAGVRVVHGQPRRPATVVPQDQITPNQPLQSTAVP